MTSLPQKPGSPARPSSPVESRKKVEGSASPKSTGKKTTTPAKPIPLPEPCPRRWGAGLLMSTIVHLILLFVLSQIYFSHPPELTATQLDTRWEESDSQELDTVTDIDIAPAAQAEAAPSSTVAETLSETVLPDTSFVDVSSQLEQGWESDLENLDLAGEVGEGDGTGQGVDGVGGMGMFSNKSSDKNIVYVVDSSASMNYPYPGPTKSRFGRVKFELLKAVHSMTAKQRFFIVFFNENAFPMPYRNMVKVNSKAAENSLVWMARKEAFGETDPTDAMQIALSLKPDTIHFLTDGELDERLVKIVKQLNFNDVRINTYCIGNRDGENVVLKIAKQNGGTYKFIP